MKDNFFGKPELWLLSCTLCLTVNNIKYFRRFKGEKNLVWHILKSLSTIVLFHLKKKNKPKLHIFVNYNFDSNIKNRTAVRNLLKKYIMNRCSACRQWLLKHYLTSPKVLCTPSLFCLRIYRSCHFTLDQ